MDGFQFQLKYNSLNVSLKDIYQMLWSLDNLICPCIIKWENCVLLNITERTENIINLI